MSPPQQHAHAQSSAACAAAPDTPFVAERQANFYIGDGRPSVTSGSLDGYEVTAAEDEDASAATGADGGWGWVVVAASFLCCFVVDGDIFTFGNFARHMQASLGDSLSRIALIGSLQSGSYLLVGPFVSALANRFGFRAVTMAGSVLSCMGFVLSAFASTSLHLCLTYGLMTGLGFGFVYVPSVLTVSFYFTRRRALATGLAVCGSGIGTFVMSILSNWLIHYFGWRGALFIKAGISLQCAVMGALFRPLTRMDEREDPVHEPLLLRIKKARDQQMRQCDSFVSCAPSSGPTHRQRSVSQCSTHPFVPQARNFSSQSLRQERGERSSKKRLSVPILDGVSLPLDCEPSTAEMVVEVPEEEEAAAEEEERRAKEASAPRSSVDSNKNTPLCENRNGQRQQVLRRHSEACTSRRRKRTEGMRPFYREDIFFSASLLRLPQYTSKSTVHEFHASVTHVPTAEELQKDEMEGHLCSLAFRRTLGTMLDCSLLASPTFLLLCFCGFLTMMGFFVPYMYLTDMAMAAGVDEDSANYLLSHLGIMNTACRVVCGWISDHPRMNALFITNLALTFGGVTTFASPFIKDETLLLVYSSVFGAAVACFASLRSIILVDLLGLEKLTNAFGLLLLFQGMAAIIGTPLAAAFYDSTGSYNYSFFLSGTLLTLSGVFCYPLNCINQWEKRKKSGAPAVKIISATPEEPQKGTLV